MEIAQVVRSEADSARKRTARAAALAQDGETGDGFTRTAIPDDLDACFRGVRADAQAAGRPQGVAAIVPDRARGVMTFTVQTRDERSRLIYLDGTTDCVLRGPRPRRYPNPGNAGFRRAFEQAEAGDDVCDVAHSVGN